MFVVPFIFSPRKSGVRFAVPDLSWCLGVLKHRAPLARAWPIFLPKNAVYMSDQLKRIILTIPKSLTACVVLPDLPPSGPK